MAVSRITRRCGAAALLLATTSRVVMLTAVTATLGFQSSKARNSRNDALNDTQAKNAKLVHANVGSSGQTIRGSSGHTNNHATKPLNTNNPGRVLRSQSTNHHNAQQSNHAQQLAQLRPDKNTNLALTFADSGSSPATPSGGHSIRQGSRSTAGKFTNKSLATNKSLGRQTSASALALHLGAKQNRSSEAPQGGKEQGGEKGQNSRDGIKGAGQKGAEQNADTEHHSGKKAEPKTRTNSLHLETDWFRKPSFDTVSTNTGVNHTVLNLTRSLGATIGRAIGVTNGSNHDVGVSDSVNQTSKQDFEGEKDGDEKDSGDKHENFKEIRLRQEGVVGVVNKENTTPNNVRTSQANEKGTSKVSKTVAGKSNAGNFKDTPSKTTRSKKKRSMPSIEAGTSAIFETPRKIVAAASASGPPPEASKDASSKERADKVERSQSRQDRPESSEGANHDHHDHPDEHSVRSPFFGKEVGSAQRAVDSARHFSFGNGKSGARRALGNTRNFSFGNGFQSRGGEREQGQGNEEENQVVLEEVRGEDQDQKKMNGAENDVINVNDLSGDNERRNDDLSVNGSKENNNDEKPADKHEGNANDTSKDSPMHGSRNLQDSLVPMDASPNKTNYDYVSQTPDEIQNNMNQESVSLPAGASALNSAFNSADKARNSAVPRTDDMGNTANVFLRVNSDRNRGERDRGDQNASGTRGEHANGNTQSNVSSSNGSSSNGSSTTVRSYVPPEAWPLHMVQGAMQRTVEMLVREGMPCEQATQQAEEWFRQYQDYRTSMADESSGNPSGSWNPNANGGQGSWNPNPRQGSWNANGQSSWNAHGWSRNYAGTGGNLGNLPTGSTVATPGVTMPPGNPYPVPASFFAKPFVRPLGYFPPIHPLMRTPARTPGKSSAMFYLGNHNDIVMPNTGENPMLIQPGGKRAGARSGRNNAGVQSGRKESKDEKDEEAKKEEEEDDGDNDDDVSANRKESRERQKIQKSASKSASSSSGSASSSSSCRDGESGGSSATESAESGIDDYLKHHLNLQKQHSVPIFNRMPAPVHGMRPNGVLQNGMSQNGMPVAVYLHYPHQQLYPYPQLYPYSRFHVAHKAPIMQGTPMAREQAPVSAVPTLDLLRLCPQRHSYSHNGRNPVAAKRAQQNQRSPAVVPKAASNQQILVHQTRVAAKQTEQLPLKVPAETSTLGQRQRPGLKLPTTVEPMKSISTAKNPLLWPAVANGSDASAILRELIPAKAESKSKFEYQPAEVVDHHPKIGNDNVDLEGKTGRKFTDKKFTLKPVLVGTPTTNPGPPAAKMPLSSTSKPATAKNTVRSPTQHVMNQIEPTHSTNLATANPTNPTSTNPAHPPSTNPAQPPSHFGYKRGRPPVQPGAKTAKYLTKGIAVEVDGVRFYFVDMIGGDKNTASTRRYVRFKDEVEVEMEREMEREMQRKLERENPLNTMEGENRENTLKPAAKTRTRSEGSTFRPFRGYQESRLVKVNDQKVKREPVEIIVPTGYNQEDHWRHYANASPERGAGGGGVTERDTLKRDVKYSHRAVISLKENELKKLMEAISDDDFVRMPLERAAVVEQNIKERIRGRLRETGKLNSFDEVGTGGEVARDEIGQERAREAKGNPNLERSGSGSSFENGGKIIDSNFGRMIEDEVEKGKRDKSHQTRYGIMMERGRPYGSYSTKRDDKAVHWHSRDHDSELARKEERTQPPIFNYSLKAGQATAALGKQEEANSIFKLETHDKNIHDNIHETIHENIHDPIHGNNNDNIHTTDIPDTGQQPAQPVRKAAPTRESDAKLLNLIQNKAEVMRKLHFLANAFTKTPVDTNKVRLQAIQMAKPQSSEGREGRAEGRGRAGVFGGGIGGTNTAGFGGTNIGGAGRAGIRGAGFGEAGNGNPKVPNCNTKASNPNRLANLLNRASRVPNQDRVRLFKMARAVLKERGEYNQLAVSVRGMHGGRERSMSQSFTYGSAASGNDHSASGPAKTPFQFVALGGHVSGRMGKAGFTGFSRASHVSHDSVSGVSGRRDHRDDHVSHSGVNVYENQIHESAIPEENEDADSSSRTSRLSSGLREYIKENLTD